MKRYYINYYQNFANTYCLYYVDQNNEKHKELLQSSNNELLQISRKRAEYLCSYERWRRKNNPAFSYLGDIYIYPIDFDKENENAHDERRFIRNKYILERK